jgi:predicted nucleotidyltransferase
MLLSLIMYGSRARGDHRQTSDVDLLGVIESGPISREVSARGASLYKYPIAPLIEKSKSGDLFLLHLCREGKVLHDTADIFARVQDCFEFKKSYIDERREASAIIWYLTERPSFISQRKVRRRLVWAIRTLVIADAAEKREALFGSKYLEEFSGVEGLKYVIDRRFTISADGILEMAQKIVQRHGLSRRALGLASNANITEAKLALFGPLAATTPNLMRPRLRSSTAYE